jgi:hypothetical protein
MHRLLYWLLRPRYWLSSISGKATLVTLFKAAKRRVAEQTDDVAKLPNARIDSATEELDQIADEVREAKTLPEASPSTVRAPANVVHLISARRA